jgi:polar amino acid transport system permease protein
MTQPITGPRDIPSQPAYVRAGCSVVNGIRNLLLVLLTLSIIAALKYTHEQFWAVVGAIAKWAPVMFHGFLFNILVSLVAMAIGTVFGAWLGLGQVSQVRIVRVPAKVATQFFRNAPWLVLLFYCIFLIPFDVTLFGTTFPFPGWLKATIGLSLPVMGNISEIVRGAVQSVPTGQWESSESLAFSPPQTMWMIILPQCIKPMLPPWMNVYAILTMATPLMSIVGVDEVMSITRSALAAEGRADLLMPMYLMIMSWFFIYCYPIARLTVELERQFRVMN